MAKEKTGNSSFESGMKYLKNFWKQRGIDERMINFVDGSGLSPQNYASTRAEVLALIWKRHENEKRKHKRLQSFCRLSYF